MIIAEPEPLLDEPDRVQEPILPPEQLILASPESSVSTTPSSSSGDDGIPLDQTRDATEPTDDTPSAVAVEAATNSDADSQSWKMLEQLEEAERVLESLQLQALEALDFTDTLTLRRSRRL